MGEVVNLRRARKQAARKAGEAAADANRVKFGFSSASKAQARREKSRADAALDGHRLEPNAVSSESGSAD